MWHLSFRRGGEGEGGVEQDLSMTIAANFQSPTTTSSSSLSRSLFVRNLISCLFHFTVLMHKIHIVELKKCRNDSTQPLNLILPSTATWSLCHSRSVLDTYGWYTHLRQSYKMLKKISQKIRTNIKRKGMYFCVLLSTHVTDRPAFPMSECLYESAYTFILNIMKYLI